LMKELLIINYSLLIPDAWDIIPSGGGYRFWPDKLKGEGFFIACFRKDGQDTSSKYYRNNNPDKFSETEIAILDRYTKKEGISFSRMYKIIHAVPENIQTEINYLQSKLRVLNFGIIIGEIIRDKLVPDHALALSGIVSNKVNKIELDFDQAILYLKRKEIKIDSEQKGWSLVTFKNHPLGWVNILPNRVNNYYPKELRILKD